MIVACPNCSLEQPLDPFCAGCGKQLPKLIEENKKKLALKKKKTHTLISGSIFFFILSAYFYYAYQQSEGLNFNATESQTTAIVLPKTKIKAESFTAEVKTEKIERTQTTLKKAQKEIKVEGKAISKKQEAFNLKPQLKTLTFVTAENCTNGEIESGGLSKEDLNIFMECSTEVFKINLSDKPTEVDESFILPTKIKYELTEKSVSINFTVTVAETLYEKSSSLAFTSSPKEKAGEIWNNPIQDFEIDPPEFKPEEINKALLASYALSSLLGLSKEESAAQKGYFLAVYN